MARTRPRPLRGRFLKRPHRFAARVQLATGRAITAHLANPGRLTGTIAPGRTVYLDGPYPPPRSLRFTVVAIREPSALVGVLTTYANRVFPTLLMSGLFPELPGGEIKAEVRRGASRFDFQVGRMLVEVKSVTLARGRAGLFPDAVTERGARHCEELTQLRRRGVPTAICFLAQRGDVDSVAPEDDVDPDFGVALREAAEGGVVVVAAALDITPLGARSARRIPVLL